MSLASAWAWIRGLFGAGDVVAGVAADAVADGQAKRDLAESARNVAEADRIAESIAPPPPFSVPATSEAAPPAAGAPEDTPPASPGARRGPL